MNPSKYWHSQNVLHEKYPLTGYPPSIAAFFGTMVQIDGDSLGKTLYTSSMTTSKAQTFPQISDAPPSLEERLAVSLAENERLVKLVDELRRKIVALEQENLALRERLNRNSTNSNQPPSQDNPFQPPPKAERLLLSAGQGGGPIRRQKVQALP